MKGCFCTSGNHQDCTIPVAPRAQFMQPLSITLQQTLRKDKALNFASSPNDFQRNTSAETAFLHLAIFLFGPVWIRIKKQVVQNCIECFKGAIQRQRTVEFTVALTSYHNLIPKSTFTQAIISSNTKWPLCSTQYSSDFKCFWKR